MAKLEIGDGCTWVKLSYYEQHFNILYRIKEPTEEQLEERTRFLRIAAKWTRINRLFSMTT